MSADIGVGFPDPRSDYRVLDSLPEFSEVARTVESSGTVVAIDVERASGIRYSERPFLLQLRLPDSPALLLDPETPGRTLGPVADALSAPTLLFHAAGQDLPSLRMVGVHPTSILDTELAGRLLGLDRVNLGAMVEHFLGIRLAKTHSAADWSTRPLPPAWLEYAALDVLVLHDLLDAILPELDELGRLEWFDQECAHLVSAPPPDPPAEPWRRLSRITSLRGPRQLARARALWQARDSIAQKRDVSPKRLLADAPVIEAARSRPRSVADVLAIDGFGGPHRSQLAPRWLAALDEADTLPDAELPSLRGPRGAHPPHASWKRAEPRAAELLAPARDALAALAEELGMTHDILLRPSTMRLWVWRAATAPGDDDQLLHEVLAGDGARPWQIDLCVPVLLDAVRTFRSGD